MSTTVKCPSCGKKVPWSTDNRWRPFCSERCRLIDLGAWASEEHVIAGSTPTEWSEDALTNPTTGGDKAST